MSNLKLETTKKKPNFYISGPLLAKAGYGPAL